MMGHLEEIVITSKVYHLKTIEICALGGSWESLSSKFTLIFLLFKHVDANYVNKKQRY